MRDHVFEHINPSDERRLPRSVLVMDNCSLHWFSPEQRNQLIEEVEALGAEILFIPQYEPRANAIEGGFSQMNKFLEDDLTLASRGGPGRTPASGSGVD